MQSLVFLLSFKYAAFIFKPGFLGVILLHHLGVNFWLDRVYLKHLEPLKLPPLPMDMCVGKGSSCEVQSFFKFALGLSFHSALSSLQVARMQLQGQSKVCEYLGPSQVFPVLMCSLNQEHLPQIVLPSLLFELSHWPSLVLLKMMPLGTTHQAEDLSPLQAEVCLPCFLLTELPCQSSWLRVWWKVSSSKPERQRFSFPLLEVQQRNTWRFYTIGFWSIKVLKWLPQKS